MAPILDLHDANHWEHIYNVVLSAQQVSTVPPIYYPIPSHTIPVTTDKRTLAIGVSSNQAEPTWVLGFFLISSCQIPGIGRANINSVPVFLGLNLIRLPNYNNEYFLRAKVPKWHKHLEFDIYKYVGPESDD